MIAAERTGRRARVIELNPIFIDVSIERWQRLTGGIALNADTGSHLRIPRLAGQHRCPGDDGRRGRSPNQLVATLSKGRPRVASSEEIKDHETCTERVELVHRKARSQSPSGPL